MEFNRIITIQDAKDFIRICPDVVAIDTEYKKGDPRVTELLSVIVADEDRAWVIPPSLLPMLTETIRARKLVFLQDYNHCDTIILLSHGCDIREVNRHNLIDMHHILDENVPHDLGSRVFAQFQDNYKKGFWDKYDRFEDAPYDEAMEYQCKDAIYTYRLGLQDIRKINSTNLSELYNHVKQLSKALLDTEVMGININTTLINTTQKEVGNKIQGMLINLRKEYNTYCEIWELEQWEKEINKRKTEKGRNSTKRPAFSFTSDKQLAWLLYRGLSLPIPEETKKGMPKTDLDTLKELVEDYPEINPVVEYKKLKGVYNTFILGLQERARDGKIYPHFNVSGTATGRISHSDPNMGNLPRDGIIRNFFIPSNGHLIIGADYEQLEVLIEANLTNDPNLIRIITEGVSKHDITAKGLGIDRSSAKTLNFALQYGARAEKVAEILHIPLSRAYDIYRRYWELYSGVSALREKVNKEVIEKGQVTNLAGRTRHFTPTKNSFILAKQQRQAYNFLIQGVAGECCNRAYYMIHNWLKANRYGRGLFSVHDEVVCEVASQDPQMPFMLMEELVHTMESVSSQFNFTYPLKAKAYGPFSCWQKA